MALVSGCFFFSGVALAQSPVTLRVNTQSPQLAIPPDFVGLSFESGSERLNNVGVIGNFFSTNTVLSPKCTEAQTLFRTLGVRNLRLGGGSVDNNNIIPTDADIDALFSFAEALNLRVIYSLRLLNGSGTQDADIAKYVWDNYGKYVQCFAIGNEPDWKSYRDPDISGWPSYLTTWRAFADIVSDSVSNAIFGGPDTGSNYPTPGATSTDYDGQTWTYLLADSEITAPNVKYIFLHNYVGQGAPNIASGVSVPSIINEMLSMTWDTTYYSALYNASCTPVAAMGFPFRLTESNSFSGFRAGASNSFATALFSLDYMHWWAEHGAAGVNFHNKQWVGNGPIYMDSNGNYQVYPIAYGIKAFDIGGHGDVDSVAITNPDNLNLTAYAVSDTDSNLFVTIINREHGSGARSADVTINSIGSVDSVMYLTAPADSGVYATLGVTLGGATINNSGPWQGKFSPLDSTDSHGSVVIVPASSAAIVKITDPLTAVSYPGSTIPTAYALSQNYPNPFNPTTVIVYRLPAAAHVTLRVYDILGREVETLVNEQENPGRYAVTFNGSNFSSGVYFYKLDAGDYSSVRKMVLIK